MQRGKHIVPVRMPQAMIDCIDRLARRRAKSNKKKDPSRAAFIRKAVMEKIQRMDRKGDELPFIKGMCAECWGPLEKDVMFHPQTVIGGRLQDICSNCADRA